MKNLVLLLFCFFANYCFAQTTDKRFLRVEYDVFYNTEIPNSKKGILEIDIYKNNAIFLLEKSDLKSGVTKNSDVISLIGKNAERYMKIDRNKNQIQFTEFIKNETLLVNDTLIGQNWNVDYSETKKIGEIVCNKATLNFRGRVFTAWYDMNSPFNFGPWKFCNLPGLILEVYDETFRYNWKASAMYFTETSKINLPVETNLKEISFKKFIDLRYNQSNASISSKMPRGVETERIDVGRTGIEIKFEWEK